MFDKHSVWIKVCEIAYNKCYDNNLNRLSLSPALSILLTNDKAKFYFKIVEAAIPSVT